MVTELGPEALPLHVISLMLIFKIFVVGGEMPVIFKTENLFLATSVFFKFLELKQLVLPGS